MSAIINFSEAYIIGVHSLVLIAQSSELINLESIAEKGGVMKNHASKVLQVLVKKGVLNSYKGPSGGFVLSKNPEDINMLDLYEMIEGPIPITQCPRGKEICPFGNCLLGGVSEKLALEIRDFLKDKTLADILLGAPLMPE